MTSTTTRPRLVVALLLTTLLVPLSLLSLPAGASSYHITLQPRSVAVPVGTAASFRATSSAASRARWQSAAPSGNFSYVPGAASATLTLPVVSLSRTGYRYRAVFTLNGSKLYSSPAVLTVTTNLGLMLDPAWSGYVATRLPGLGSAFTYVSASWTVPSVRCTPRDSYSSVWVGIDGYTSPTVEQLGTEQDCSNATPFYSSWYEMFADPAASSTPTANTPGNPALADSATLDPSIYPTHPGDQVSASLALSHGYWVFTIKNSTASWLFSTSVPSPSPPPSQVSAEWILERTSLCNQACVPQPLAAISPITFTQASAATSSSSGSIAAFPHYNFDMLVGSSTLATPGPLRAGGSSFTLRHS